MIECPACAGPVDQRLDCATCNGNLEVTQEVYDAFMALKEKQERLFDFASEVNEKIQNGIDEEMSFTIGEETINYTP